MVHFEDGSARFIGDFVARDPVDLRDFPYTASLGVLRPAMMPASDQLPPLVRDQGETGHCTGHALAALIDVQRAVRSPDQMASAEMLYRMGAFHDELSAFDHPRAADAAELATRMTTRAAGLRSLRSVLKGFFHHGVCLDRPPGTRPADADSRWPGAAVAAGTPAQVFPTVAQAKAARGIRLGAFYRLQAVLNDYHAALNEVGGILVSAQIHKGWWDPFRPGVDRIGAFGFDRLHGDSHAFVIVGYTDAGFVVLNSWGAGWGGLAGLPGVALWPYDDWAQTVMDGWVLRLAVPSPAAFDLAVGEQGWRRSLGLVRSAAPRGSQLIGHYLHLDDGFHVSRGAFPSDGQSWAVTARHLRQPGPAGPAGAQAPPPGPDRRGVLLWIPGSVESLDGAARAAIARKPRARALGLYPYSFFWSHLFADKSLEVLTTVFQSCLERVGAEGAQLDALIEAEVRGVGRAFWREIERSAQRAVRGPGELPEEPAPRTRRRTPRGALLAPFRDMLRLCADEGRDLHVVAEGAGVLVLHELLRAEAEAPERSRIDPARGIATLHLVHPAIDMQRAARFVLPLVAALNADPARPPRARILHADPALEARSSFGLYRGSLLRLVARAFEDRLADADTCAPPARRGGRLPPPTHPAHPPRTMLGMAAARGHPCATAASSGVGRAFLALGRLRDPRLASGRVPHEALVEDPRIDQFIYRIIRRYSRHARSS